MTLSRRVPLCRLQRINRPTTRRHDWARPIGLRWVGTLGIAILSTVISAVPAHAQSTDMVNPRWIHERSPGGITS